MPRGAASGPCLGPGQPKKAGGGSLEGWGMLRIGRGEGGGEFSRGGFSLEDPLYPLRIIEGFSHGGEKVSILQKRGGYN